RAATGPGGLGQARGAPAGLIAPEVAKRTRRSYKGRDRRSVKGMRNILVATDDTAAAGAVERSFSETFAVRRAQRRDGLPAALEKENVDVLFIDLDWLDRRKEERSSATMKTALGELWAKAPNLEIIVLTPQGNIREAVTAVKA